MDRRNFLATAATFIIAPGLLKPVKFQYSPPRTQIDLFRLKASLLYLSIEELLRHQFILINKDKRLWKGPKIVSAAFDDKQLILESEQCLYKERIEYDKIGIFEPGGVFKAETNAENYFGYINPHDSLKITYRIVCANLA